LPVLELVGVGLAVLAFIVAFLPWARPEVPDGVDLDSDVSASGWDLPLPTAVTVLLLVAALLVATPLLRRSKGDADDRSAASPLPALLAVLAAVLAIVFVIAGGANFGPGLEHGIGTWLGLLLALGTAAVLLLSWLQRSGRMSKPTPAAGPSNWGQPSQPAQPQGWGGQPQPNSVPHNYGAPPDWRPATTPHGQSWPPPGHWQQPAQQPVPQWAPPSPNQAPPAGGNGTGEPGGQQQPQSEQPSKLEKPSEESGSGQDEGGAR